MASAETALYSLLSSASGITSLIGLRIYPGIAPQTAREPFIVFRLVSDPPVRVMGGDTTLRHPRFSIFVHAGEYDEVKTIRDAVQTAMRDKSGTYDTLTVQHIYYEDENDGYDPTVDRYYTVLDYTMWYTAEAGQQVP